jgi:AraC family transcriptional regulator of adaptative response/methylated-DNA-[protein]-cysteine methyltransferase
MAGFVQHLHYRQLDAEEDAIRLMPGVDTSLQFPESSLSMMSEDVLYDSTLPYMKASPENDISDQTSFPQIPDSPRTGDVPVFDLASYHADGDQWYTALDEGIGLSPMPPIEQDPFASLLAPFSSDTTFPWVDSYPDVSGFNILEVSLGTSNQVKSKLYQFPSQTPPTHPNTSRPAAASNNSLDTDSQRWYATQSRSRAADRCFVYGVLSTKIFCRPSCAARRPSRKHVRFFPFPGAIEAAEAVGFRPCKRCIPNAIGAKSTAVLGICKALRLVIANAFSENNVEKKVNMKLESLAKSAGLSIFHFHRTFKATTRITPGDFIYACRSLALQDTLGRDHAQGSKRSIDAVALVEESPWWSIRSARKALGGISPTEYAAGATNIEIRYCFISTPPGPICVVYSPGNGDDEMKVHAVLLGEDAEARACVRFPTAAASHQHFDCVAGHIEELEEGGKDRDTELPAEHLIVLWRARVWLRLIQS